MKTEQEKLLENPANKVFNSIDFHNKIITHLEEASKQYTKAIKHSEEGEQGKEYQCILRAQHHSSLAADAQTEMLKHFPFTS